MGIVYADQSNLREWTELALLLFPDSNFEEEFAMHEKFLDSEREVGLLYRADDQYVGFMNLSIRHDYVNGTNTSPVVFVEAIYVLPDYRKQGIGRAFLAFAEQYAKERGITQLASDAFTHNSLSEQFHKGCGFVEKERVICFVKDIN